jgi:alpha-tubulin suppressor-like RCC1 family protein
LFVKIDGTLWTVGENFNGQLGNGTPFYYTNVPSSMASNVVAVAAGDAHTLFVTADGTLWAMGWNGYGQLGNGTINSTNLPVSVASNVVAVAAGYQHSLFVKTDGTLWATGYNYDGELGNGTTVSNTLPIIVTNQSVANIFPADAAYHSLELGINYHATVTLGNLNQLYTGSAISPTVVTIPSGLIVNLTYNGSPNAPTNPGSYTVIGSISDPNYYGSVTNTLVINPNASVTLGNLNQAYTGSAISVTASTTPPGLMVNLIYNGSPNAPVNPGSYTVIGNISTPNYAGIATNTLVITGPTVAPTSQTVAAGGTVTLSLTVSNTALAYQWFKDNRLIVGATNSTLTVANAGVINSGTYFVVITNISGMVISLPSMVAVGNPSLLAWGSNDRGQLGNGTTTDAYTPISVASNVVAGAAGGHHSLFVDTNGTLWVMGSNVYGQLGNGTTVTSTNWPVSVASNVVAVTAGLYHSLFVKTDGTLWVMGYNGSGQLGNGTTSNTNRPISVASNVVAVAAGYFHSLFVKADGTLWAMGYNNYGQLGNGKTTDAHTPVSVASNVVAVAAGYYHSLFVKTDGTLWAMGYNNYGQLGNGTTSNTNLPVSVASNVVAAAAGAYHSLFVDTNRTIWAMGWNGTGQFGNGTTINTNLPVSVAGNVVAVAAGASYSLFTKSDGTFWTMGYNFNGQLGNGTNNNVPNPTPINLPQLSVANIFPADTANHSLAMGIIKASATVTLGNLNQLYTGSAISVTASTTPPGLTVSLTYNGSPNAPTNAGSYTVIGVISDPNYYGIATNTLVVGAAPQGFTAGSVSGQQLILQLAGTPGYPYILQMATNLTPPVVWQCVFTNCADTNGNCNFTVTNLSGVPAGFYRAVGQ